MVMMIVGAKTIVSLLFSVGAKFLSSRPDDDCSGLSKLETTVEQFATFVSGSLNAKKNDE